MNKEAINKNEKVITLSSGTGYQKEYIGYKGMPINEWNHLLNLEKWFYGGLVNWIYLDLTNNTNTYDTR